nr:F-box domain, leucine-rich repeat domain, L domain-like protein [Tanacetum cinerariifolium]
IFDVVDEDDDITDDVDALPHDLADSDNKNLINVDDDGVDKMSADVARSYGGDGGGKGKRKPNLGGRAAGKLNTRDKTRNLSLKEITDTKGPVPIQFKLRDKQTVMPFGNHAAHLFSYIGEVIRGVPLYYPSWLKVPKERKATLIIDFGVAHEIPRLDRDQRRHPAALTKSVQYQQAAFKAQHWVIDPTTGTYNVEKIRRARHENITASEWDKYIQFWNDPRNIARAAQNQQNWAKSTIEEIRRLEATGTYTDNEINRLARGGKQRGHILGMGRVLPAWATASPSTPAHESMLNSLHKKVDFMMRLSKSDSKYSDMFSQFESGGASGSGGCGDDEEGVDDQDDEDEDGDGFGTGLRIFLGDMSSGNMCHRGTNFLTGKYVGPIVSLGIVAREGIPYERSPVNIPRRQVAEEMYPQRQVVGESLELSLGNGLNVVVTILSLNQTDTIRSV